MRGIKYLLLFCIMSVSVNLFGQEIETLIFSDIFNDKVPGKERISIPILSKEQRLSNKATTILRSYSDVPIEVQKCIEFAVIIWESNIENSQPLKIKFEYADIDEDIRTEVVYNSLGGVLYPYSLCVYNGTVPSHNSNSYDGTIYINKNKPWDYSVGEKISANENNLTYGLVRAIGRILGFGSTIKINNNGNYYFGSKRAFSYFDGLITTSDNKFLTNIPLMGGKENIELTSFVNDESREFFVKELISDYKLAKGPYTKNKLPLTLMEKGLMASEIETGDYNLQIDNITKSILGFLGWNILDNNKIAIRSNEIGENGIASAYEEHLFYIDSSMSEITNPKWTFRMPLRNGKESVVSLNDKGLKCIVPQIENEELYDVTVDGVICCTLEFSCMNNGNEIKAYPFKVYLELKPKVQAKIIEVKDNSPYDSYDAFYEVTYTGSESIMISVEEEYGSRLKTWHINEPFYVKGVADHITAPFYAWIDFIVENK